MFQIWAANTILFKKNAILIVHEETHIQENIIWGQVQFLQQALKSVLDEAEFVFPGPRQIVCGFSPVSWRKSIHQCTTISSISWADAVLSKWHWIIITICTEKEGLLQGVKSGIKVFGIIRLAAMLDFLQEFFRSKVGNAYSSFLVLFLLNRVSQVFDVVFFSAKLE